MTPQMAPSRVSRTLGKRTCLPSPLAGPAAVPTHYTGAGFRRVRDRVRTGGPSVDPHRSIPDQRQNELRRSASDLLLVERTREWLLGEVD
jgi:hypothetical protein